VKNRAKEMGRSGVGVKGNLFPVGTMFVAHPYGEWGPTGCWVVTSKTFVSESVYNYIFIGQSIYFSVEEVRVEYENVLLKKNRWKIIIPRDQI